MEATVDQTETSTSKSEQLPALPFKYERTLEPDKANYTYDQNSGLDIKIEGIPNKLSTDEEIIETIKKEREDKDWFTNEYWRNKGLPEEQIEFQVNAQTVTIYNWNKDKPFTDEHIQKA